MARRQAAVERRRTSARRGRPFRRPRGVSRRGPRRLGPRRGRRYGGGRLVRGTAAAGRRDPPPPLDQAVRREPRDHAAVVEGVGARAVQGPRLRAAAVLPGRGGAVQAPRGATALARAPRRFEPAFARAHSADRADPLGLLQGRGADDGRDRRRAPLGASGSQCGADAVVAPAPARILHASAVGAPRLPEALRVPRRLRSDAVHLRAALRRADPVR